MKSTALDYVLGWAASVSALISTGIALKNESAAVFFSVLVTLSYAAAYCFRSLSTRFLIRYTTDGIALFVITMLCIGGAQVLNKLIPADGFPPNLIHTVALCWMIVLGALVTWSDSTLMFLVVPSIALFGLVGAFDTFVYAPAMFFVFMLASATLFARAHLRASAERSERIHSRQYVTLARYEWSSVAGPEWALASAMIIITFSAIGAPVIQRSVQDFTKPIRTGNANFTNPVTTSQNDLSTAGTQIRLSIGQGPIGKPSQAPVMKVAMSKPVLLRGRTYSNYRDHEWYPVDDGAGSIIPKRGVFDVNNFLKKTRELDYFENYSFRIILDRPGLTQVFAPGELNTVSLNRDGAVINYDGTFSTISSFQAGEQITGTTFIPSYKGIEKAYSIVPDWIPNRARSVYTDTGLLDPRVKTFAEGSIKGAKSDYERAENIRVAVSKTITYNLQAAKISSGRDPVVDALFESKQGYCDLFATSFTICARSVGLVSRIAIGYLVDPSEEISPGVFQVRDSHYHMWSEVYLQGYGWVPFDATEGAQSIDGNGRGASWVERKSIIDEPSVKIALFAFLGMALVTAATKYGKLILNWIQWNKSIAHPAGFVPSPYQISLNSAVAKSIKKFERTSKIPRPYGHTPREFLATIDAKWDTHFVDGDYLNRLECALYSSDKTVSAKEIESLSAVELGILRNAIKKSKK